MTRKFTFLSFLSCLFLTSAFAQYSNVPVTGFNADEVANGIGLPGTTTTGDVDGGTYVFIDGTYQYNSTCTLPVAGIMPANNQVASLTTAGLTYNLQSYTGNNALRVPAAVAGTGVGTGTGTLTLTTPSTAGTIYLLAVAGGGAISSGLNITVNFTDGINPQVFTGQSLVDWCSGTSPATGQLNRIQISSVTGCSTGASCQYLYEMQLPLSIANYTRSIASITIAKTTSTNVLNVFAVGKKAPCTVPAAQPTALVFTAGSAQISGSFTAATGAPSNYLVVRYPAGAVVTAPTSGTIYSNGQALGLGTVVSNNTTTTFAATGLIPSTSYDFYVYAYNSGTCSGPLYATGTALSGTATTVGCGSVSGTINVGPGLPNTVAGGFTSLTNAMSYINNTGLGGNTTLALQTGYNGTNTNETFPITFPSNPCVGAGKSLTIKPATGVTGLLITDSLAGTPLIDFNGATYVTIDGVNNGLTISNRSAAATANTSTIRFINDATKCTVTNCTVLGSALVPLGTTGGTIYFATGINNGNDSISITNCKISAAGGNTPSKGIYSQGSTSSANSANSAITINNNEISDFFLTGGCAGIYDNTGNTIWTITNNRLYQSATRNFTTSGTMYGIYFSSSSYGAQTQITGNTIGYSDNGGGGVFSLAGSTFSGSFYGIYFSMNSSDTNTCNISNNNVTDISLTSSSGSFYGIYNASGANGNTININNNHVTNINTITTTSSIYGISWSSATNLSIQNNLIDNIRRAAAGTIYGLYSGSSSINETISNNTVSNFVSTASGSCTYYGIYQNTASGIKFFQNNKVFNFTGLGGTTMYGIRIGYGTTIDVSGNTIYNLNSTGGTSGTIYGLYAGTVGTTYNVYKNKIYNLSMGGTTTAIVYGLYCYPSVTLNAYNNYIGDLSSTAYTSSSAPYLGVMGIYLNSGTNNIYNNTVYIGNVTSAGTNFSTAGIYANNSSTTLLQNNLVVNRATPVGSGKAIAYYRSTTSLTSYANASNNNAFFAGTPGASNLIFWDGTNAYQTLAAYQTAVAPRDQLAITNNPAFISTFGSDATYLHIPAATATPLESGGVIVPLFNVDFDGDLRPGPVGSVNGGGLSYDIGADEFDAASSFTCTTPAPGNTISSANNLCNGAVVTLSLQNTIPGTGITYKWFGSVDGVTYTLITGATSSTYTTTPPIATYYKCTVTCGGTLSTTSTPVLVNFNNNVTTTTPGVRCGTGTVTLGATATSGTLSWYSDLNGGVALGTGASFTTPNISVTDTFYVGAESFAPGTSASIGNGTTTNGSSGGYPTAFGDYWYQDWEQMVYTAAEMHTAGLAAGNLTSVTFKTAAASSSAPNLYSIKIASTTNSTLSAFTTTGLTQVYAAATQPNTAGFTTLTFSTPYLWDGVSNIILDIRQTENYGNANATTYNTTTTGNTVVYAYTTSNNASFWTSNPTAITSTSRPNVIFGGNAICSSPRAPVIATVNTAPALTVTPSQTICNNAVTPLNVTTPLANYNSYVWTPATNLYTDAAATIAYAGGSASTVYLKTATANAGAAYTVSANNSTTLCAQVAGDTVTILPAALTATSSPSIACMTGTASLTLNPSTGFGTGSFQWQSSSDNVSFANTTTTTVPAYTAPATTATQYYRAVLKNGAGAVCINSSSDTLRIYNPIVSTTIPASKCGPGVLTLGATASDGSLNWYAAATGGTSIGNGASFTTPSLTTSTTYYVEAQSYASATGVVGAGGTTIGGSGTSPFAQFYEGARTQYLITPADLNAAGIYAGSLTSLSFNVSSKVSTLPYTAYTIKLGTTTVTSLSSILTSSMTSVYGPATYSSVLGDNPFAFATPYVWDGVSNLVVDICFSNDPGSTGTFWTSNDVATATTKTYTATYGMYADNSALCGATTGGTNTSTTTLPVITFTEAGCTSPRLPVVATINPNPTASVTPSPATQICAGTTATLTATGGTAYQWRNAAGNIAGQTNSTFTTGTGGAYRVVAITAATGCSDTSAAVTVTVNPLPIVNLGNDTTFCSGPTLALNAGAAATGTTFQWDNNTTAPTRNVTATGTYYVKVTNTYTCVTRDTIVVTVNPTPVVNLGIDTFVCTGTSYTLNAQNPGAVYVWDDASTAQTRTVTTSGTYSVKVTNTYNCSNRDTAVVTYLVSPTVNLGNDISACAGDVVTLNAGNPGNSYLWDNGTVQQTRNVTTSGSYHVVVTNAANCKGYDTVMVTVHALPIVNLGNDTTICHGQVLVLDAGNPGDTYVWTDNSTNQTLSVNATGTYGVHVTDMYHCVGTDNLSLFVKPLPSGTINAVHGDTATYTFNILNPQYVTAYVWDFGDGTPFVTGGLVQHRYAHNGQYLVSVIFVGECADTSNASRTVEVYDVVGGGTAIHQVANAKDLSLYPNPARDLVIVENLGNLNLEHITVYNVLGQKVYDQPADNKMKHSIRTSTLISGMYTVRIETSGGTVIRKFEILK
jgi:hypothetical protein